MFSLVIVGRGRSASVRRHELIRGFSSKKQRLGKESEGKYSKTVQLPITNFSQRANAAQREPEIQQYWAEHNIYSKVNAKNRHGTYVLHDGPPYANGVQ